MRRTLSLLLAMSSFALPGRAQTTEIGLTMDGGMLTVIYGQSCGPVGCQPFFGGPVGALQPRTLVHYGAPQSIYLVVIGLPGGCLPIPGIDNPLLLTDPVLVIGSGITSAPPFVPLPCNQGIAAETLLLPAGLPAGLAFRIQSLGVGNSGALGFSPAIEATVF